MDSKGRGKVIETDIPIECGGVLVRPGDIIFGDADGCIVVPKELEKQVLNEGRSKLNSEDRSLKALREGKKLTDVYKKFGVL